MMMRGLIWSMALVLLLELSPRVEGTCSTTVVADYAPDKAGEVDSDATDEAACELACQMTQHAMPITSWGVIVRFIHQKLLIG